MRSDTFLIMGDLSDRQKRFCEEFTVDCNAGAAYRRAGYDVTTDGAAWSNASRLMRNAKVQAYLQQLREGLKEKTDTEAIEWINEIKRLAFSDITHYLSFDNEGLTLKDSRKLLKEHTAAIEAITITSGRDGKSVKLKLYNKLDALEKLGKHLGLFHDFNTAIATLRSYGIELTPEQIKTLGLGKEGQLI